MQLDRNHREEREWESSKEEDEMVMKGRSIE